MFHPNLISDWDGFFSEGRRPLVPYGFVGFHILVSLFTVGVFPTTCSLTTCLITCMGIHYARRIVRRGYPLYSKNCAQGVSTMLVENYPKSPFSVDKPHGRKSLRTP